MQGFMKTATNLSRLALVTALLLSSSTSANELTPEQRAWYRAQLGLEQGSIPAPQRNSVAEAVIEWRALGANQYASFDQLSRFLTSNPGWPDADKLRARAEKALAIDSFSPPRDAGLFRGQPAAHGQRRTAPRARAESQRPARCGARCAAPGMDGRRA